MEAVFTSVTYGTRPYFNTGFHMASPQAVQAGAKGIWLQSGIISHEARQIAAAAGIDYVDDHCLMVEHHRNLFEMKSQMT